MFKYLKSKFNKTRIISTKVLSFVMTLSMLSRPDIVSSAMTSTDSHILTENKIVVSTVIPNNASAESMSEEVIEEVRLQEALEEKIKAELEEQARLQAIEEQKNYINSIVCDPTNVSRVSGLKESDYALLTQGTWWEGNEAALIRLEQDYGINAMFAMSVSTLESGFGTSERAQSRNNYYGMELPNYWYSLYDNTQYWGNLIAKYYVGDGRYSVESISTKYCPPNSTYWASYNRDKMYDLYYELINRLNDTTL